MGQTGNRKIVTVIVIFILAVVFVYGKPELVRSTKKRSLSEALTEVGGWKAGPQLPFDRKIVDTLALDDYVNRVFVKGDKTVALYIGYYLTSGKLGAAHDPLVCFPGQGWDVSGRNGGILKVNDGTDVKTVSYSTMTVKQGAENNHIILYWFQAYEIASASTLLQKITAIMQTFSSSRDDNAFVRLTCATAKTSESECIETMRDFTKAFYPVFLDYIRE